MSWLWAGGDGPHDMPQWAYSHLVVTLKADPNTLSSLKCVTEETYQEGKPVTAIRIFDPAAAGKRRIREFASLDRHPELVAYEGYLDKETGAVRIARFGG